MTYLLLLGLDWGTILVAHTLKRTAVAVSRVCVGLDITFAVLETGCFAWVVSQIRTPS